MSSPPADIPDRPGGGDDPVAAGAPLRGWLARRLRPWFRRHRRQLPWRTSRDAYRIWLSEVMLQQTQVATVIPYFERFLRRFPTLADLAAASEQEVLKLWEGLGYYRRARGLLEAAREMTARHGGSIPNDPEALRLLPGFGRYTCNAVLSQAYDRRLPILEVNTERVLSRLFGRRQDPSKGPARSWLWQVAEEVLPRRGAGEINQALMELGSLVCTPTAPRCPACPLRERCTARRLGEQDVIPARPPAPPTVQVRETGVVIVQDQRILLVQRPPTGRWAGLWEVPHAPRGEDEADGEAAIRIARELTGIEVEAGAEILAIRHAVTRYRIALTAVEGRRIGGSFASSFYAAGRWLAREELASYPVSAPQRRLIQALDAPGRQGRLF